jgi:hypothetical protein
MSDPPHPEQLPALPRVPGLSPRRYQPAAPYRAPEGGTIEQRLADIAEAINGKADRVGTPNFTAITLHGENGTDYLIYVDAAGTLRCEPVTLP